jgi:hypothetical protein
MSDISKKSIEKEEVAALQRLPIRRDSVDWHVLLGLIATASAAALAFRFRIGSRWVQAAGAADGVHASEVLSLYRRIVRTARDWPSVNKQQVIAGIRDEFRANLGEADPQKQQRMLAQARSGLKELLHGAKEAARLRATPSAPKGAWPLGADAGTQAAGEIDQWALDELGVGRSPTMSQAKLAYHERAKACHPDSGTSSANAEAFKRLQHAWDHVQQHIRRSRNVKRYQ